MSAADFDAAVNYVKTAPAAESSTEVKLNYYKFYKQATEGDIQGAQPYAVQFEKRAKWDAWNSVKGMDKETAKAEYVKLLTSIVPNWKN